MSTTRTSYTGTHSGLVDRRTFIAGAGALLVSGLSARSAEALEGADALFGAACRTGDGSFACAVFTEDGRIVSTVQLPDRGHDVAFDPVARRAVAFGRRPRTFAVVFDPLSGAILRTLASLPGRHFFGHGFFSPGGRLLYATENDFDAARGLIGVYDVEADFRRIGEFDTHGMDTHEALLMPDGETIVVANGGIETHPDYGRQKLNLATMDPSLVFIDRRTGDLLEKHRLPSELHQLSIRHIAIDGRDRVWFGCQYEGPKAEAPQIAGFAERGHGLTLASLPERDLAQMANYVGSVAMNRERNWVALSSPVGDTLLVLDAGSGAIVSRRTLRDGCGLAPSRPGFIATSGTGNILHLADEREPPVHAPLEWDNHILALGSEQVRSRA